MQRMWLVGLVVAGLFLVSGARGAGDDDKKGMQGTWQVISGEKAGQKAADGEANAMVVIITEEAWTFSRGEKREELKLSVDSTTTPKQITLTSASGSVRRGIYEINGDKLRLCLSGTDARPKEFATSKESRNVLMSLERKKD